MYFLLQSGTVLAIIVSQDFVVGRFALYTACSHELSVRADADSVTRQLKPIRPQKAADKERLFKGSTVRIR